MAGCFQFGFQEGKGQLGRKGIRPHRAQGDTRQCRPYENSADHGLEDNATRVERGKPEVGSIFLKAFQEGNNVIIEVGDDGNGIDVAAVRDKAVERGVITAEQAENMSQKEIINILFLPSFSMAKKITDISGRGVGLDVVKSNIEALGGDVEVRTQLGEGTTFIVRLPLTLAIIQALMVETMGKTQEIIEKQNMHIESTEQMVNGVMGEIDASIERIRQIETRTKKLESARTEIIDVIDSLSEIAQQNVEGTTQTSSSITEITDSFQNIKDSTENLRNMADMLAHNIRHFDI